MRTELVTITKALAEKYLSANSGNRKLRMTTVERYAHEMRMGRWLQSHQGIAFDIQGRLLDGQHRLAAIALSGVEIPMLVTHGLPDGGQKLQTMDVIDAGRPRTVADQLQVKHGIKNAAITAAIARHILLIVSPEAGHGMTVAKTLIVLDHTRMALTEMVGITINFKPVHFSPVLAALTLAAKCDYDAAVQFTTGLASGVDLKAKSPVLILRNALINRGAIHTNAFDVYREQTASAFFHFVKGGSIESVRRGRGGIEWLIERNERWIGKMKAQLGFE